MEEKIIFSWGSVRTLPALCSLYSRKGTQAGYDRCQSLTPSAIYYAVLQRLLGQRLWGWLAWGMSLVKKLRTSHHSSAAMQMYPLMHARTHCGTSKRIGAGADSSKSNIWVAYDVGRRSEGEIWGTNLDGYVFLAETAVKPSSLQVLGTLQKSLGCCTKT